MFVLAKLAEFMCSRLDIRVSRCCCRFSLSDFNRASIFRCDNVLLRSAPPNSGIDRAVVRVGCVATSTSRELCAGNDVIVVQLRSNASLGRRYGVLLILSAILKTLTHTRYPEHFNLILNISSFFKNDSHNTSVNRSMSV